GTSAAGFSVFTASMIPPWAFGRFVAKYARARLRTKKIVARTSRVRDRKLAEPVAPKRLLEAPPPKPEPMSAPLPCWSSTRPMIASATSTCSPITTFSQLSIRSFPLLRRGGDRREIRRHERGSADQPAVHVRHPKKDRRAVLFHATS